MKRFFIIVLLVPFVMSAQNADNQFIDKGLFSMKGTLAVGFPSAYEGTNMYVSGNCEYYLEKNVSFRGGLYMFLGTSGADDVFKQNSTLFTGFYYHPKTNNHLDPYIGIEPGISWTQLKAPDEEIAIVDPKTSSYPNAASPIVSGTIGINYYASNFAHLFIEAKYLSGVHASDVAGVSLNEFRIAFGFGFNFWAIKK
jgi:hypothetical protein